MGGGVEDREFPGVLKKEVWKFQGSNRGVQPWVLAFDLRISKGCHTILQIFQAWKLLFSRISKVKLVNLKIPEGFFEKSISSISPVWIFFEITQFHSTVYVILCHKIMLFVILLGTSKIYFLYWFIDEILCSFVYYQMWE